MRACFLLPLLPLAMLLPSPPSRAELLWPLQQPPSEQALSSSFCEDRGSHLHGGVDMSTGGRVGLPVVAVADGEVVRVGVKYRGLGRALYVQHAGGLMSVYGHLAGFAEPMRTSLDELMDRRGPYPGDWFPEAGIPVTAGQVIAWSGKTGGGPPHLHFETRREGGNRPVDPWVEGLPCIDTTPPVIEEVAVMPPQGAWKESVHSLPLSAPLALDGSELLRLRVRDPFAAGTGFVRRLVVSLDGRELYRWDADSYSYGVTNLAGHAFSRAAPLGADPGAAGSWIWLLEWPGGGLPFVTGRQALEAWDLGAAGARLELVVEAVDGCGNLAVERLPVQVGARPVQVGARPAPAEGALLRIAPDPAPSEEASAPMEARGTIRPRAAFELRLGGAILSIPAGGVSSSVEAILRTQPFGPNRPPEGLRLVAGPVEALPAWLPLARKAALSFAVPSGVDPRRLGVHRFNPASGRWQFWGDDLARTSRLGSTTDRLGVFALLEDAFPPRLLSVERRRVTGRPWRADADEFVVRYEERGEGIGWDGIRFRPEATEVEWTAEHDPDEHEAVFSLPAPFAGTRLRGVLILEDRAGHLVEERVDSAP